jgi:hypothetical protein
MRTLETILKAADEAMTFAADTFTATGLEGFKKASQSFAEAVAAALGHKMELARQLYDRGTEEEVEAYRQVRVDAVKGVESWT